jgi:arabinan endo-1,5-alpha-L-arabinosidase
MTTYRATAPRGPTPVREGPFIGPGGQSVLTDADGDLIVYHYYDAGNNGSPTLGLDLLGYDAAGWPFLH